MYSLLRYKSNYSTIVAIIIKINIKIKDIILFMIVFMKKNEKSKLLLVSQ